MYLYANSAMRRRERIESPSCAVRTMQQPDLGRLHGLRGYRSLGAAPSVASDLIPDWLKTTFNYWTFQPNWTDPNAPFVWTPAQYTAQTGAPPAPASSSYTDLLLNALTGKASTDQIQSNINDCVAQVQHMRAVAAQSGSAGPPADAEQQCAQVQSTFMANAVSPSSILKSVLPSTTTSIGLLAVLGIGGAIALYVWLKR